MPNCQLQPHIDIDFYSPGICLIENFAAKSGSSATCFGTGFHLQDGLVLTSSENVLNDGVLICEQLRFTFPNTKNSEVVQPHKRKFFGRAVPVPQETISHCYHDVINPEHFCLKLGLQLWPNEERDNFNEWELAEQLSITSLAPPTFLDILSTFDEGQNQKNENPFNQFSSDLGCYAFYVPIFIRQTTNNKHLPHLAPAILHAVSIRNLIRNCKDDIFAELDPSLPPEAAGAPVLRVRVSPTPPAPFEVAPHSAVAAGVSCVGYVIARETLSAPSACVLWGAECIRGLKQFVKIGPKDTRRIREHWCVK